jgi:hypothetical protein
VSSVLNGQGSVRSAKEWGYLTYILYGTHEWGYQLFMDLYLNRLHTVMESSYLSIPKACLSILFFPSLQVHIIRNICEERRTEGMGGR